MVNFMGCDLCINKAFIKKEINLKEEIIFSKRAHLLCPNFLENVKKK